MERENEFKVGQMVAFTEEGDKGDLELRYIVLEVNGDRMMVRLVCDLIHPPIQNFPTAMFKHAGV